VTGRENTFSLTAASRLVAELGEENVHNFVAKAVQSIYIYIYKFINFRALGLGTCQIVLKGCLEDITPFRSSSSRLGRTHPKNKHARLVESLQLAPDERELKLVVYKEISLS
jgi:hypothetical protein